MLTSEQPNFRLKRLIGRILQDDGTDADRTRRDRLALYLMLGIPVVAFFIVNDILLGSYVSAGIICISLGLLVASMCMLQKGWALGAPTRCFLFAVCWLLGTSHFWDGQYESKSLWLVPVIPMCAAFVQGVRAAYLYFLVALGIILVAMFSSLHIQTTQWIEDTELQCLVLRMAAMVFFAASGILSRHVTRNQRRLLDQQQTEVDRVKAEHDAAATSKSLFFANFSHEIRTPMNGILGMTQHLLGQPLPHKVRESIGLMHRCAEDLLGLLNQILDLSALEARRDLDEQPSLLIGEAITRWFDNAANEDRSTVIKLTQTQVEGLLVVADEEVLQKALGLILEYAASCARDNEVRVLVQGSPSDSGDPFIEVHFEYEKESGSQDGEHKVGATGVALSIAEQLANLMDAKLLVQPPARDPHAQITLRLIGESSSTPQRLSRSLPGPSNVIRYAYKALRARLKKLATDTSRSDRSKVLTAIHLVIAPATLGFSIYAYVYGYRLGFILHIVAVFLFLISAWVNYKKRFPKLASWLSVAASFIIVALHSFADGQIRSETLWLLPLIPVGTLFILNHRAFVGVFIACSVFLVGVFWSSTQYTLPQEYQESFSYLLLMRLTSLQLFSGMCILAAYVSRHFSRRYTKRRVAMLKALRDSELAHEEKSRFLTNMSHEIRTPMNGILGLTESLIDHDLPQNQKHAIQTIHRCGGHLLALLGDVFDMSELRSGQHGLSKVPMCLHEVINDVVCLFEAKARLKGVALQALGADSELRVMGDRTRIVQVLSNLVGNAVKFSDQGSVQVALVQALAKPAGQQAGFQVLLEVRDQGIGIAESRLDLLFNSFVQIEASHGEARGGTGLGLAISRRLIRAMGGELKVESTAGEGSVFRVELWMESGVSASKEAATDQQLPSTGTASVAQTRKTREILVVDDNLINLKVAVASLQRLGYEAHTASGGQAAIELAQQRPFDAILMDVRMPQVDGIEATKAIRNGRGPCKDVPIMALTAESYETQIQLCLESGMNGHLTKPFRSEDLQEKLLQLWATPDAA